MHFLREKLAALGVSLGLNALVLCFLIHALATENQMRTHTTGFLINYFISESIYALQGITVIVTESEKYMHECDLYLKIIGLLFLKLLVFDKSSNKIFVFIALAWIKYLVIKLMLNYNPHLVFVFAYILTFSLVVVLMITDRFSAVSKYKLYFICVSLMVSIGNLLYALGIESDFIISFNFLQILNPIFFLIFWYFGDEVFQTHSQSLCRKRKDEDEIEICCDDDNASININFSKSNATV